MEDVIALMTVFAKETGLDPPKPTPKRYLWTDAFAVCNFLGLYLDSSDSRFLKLALDLVDQVHHVLGKHRDDDALSRRGNSGASSHCCCLKVLLWLV
jgi:hypothetical protein